LDEGGNVGFDLGGYERGRGRPGQRPDDRQYDYSRSPALGGRKKGGPGEGLGRSRGGLSTKIHLRTNGIGLPVAVILTGGQVSDVKGFDPLMSEPGPHPKVMIGDKGYDANHIRDNLDRSGVTAVIPPKRNRKVQNPIDGYIYATRNLVERCFSKLKHSRRLATRYDKTADSFLGFVVIASIRLWIRHFVHTT
jgi:transposase